MTSLKGENLVFCKNWDFFDFFVFFSKYHCQIFLVILHNVNQYFNSIFLMYWSVYDVIYMFSLLQTNKKTKTWKKSFFKNILQFFCFFDPKIKWIFWRCFWISIDSKLAQKIKMCIKLAHWKFEADWLFHPLGS